MIIIIEKLADTLQSKNETLSSEYDAYQTKKGVDFMLDKSVCGFINDF